MELTFDKASFGKRFGVNAGERSDDPSALNIYEATERSFSLDVPHEMRDSALEYELKLYNGANVRALIYLVYAEPLTGAKAPGQTPALGLNGAPLTDDGGDNAWLPVTRARCAKGCAGPILSAIQRFGKQGRTQKGGAGKEPLKPDSGQDKWKDARNLFISIDEASNHVCAFGPNKCKVFRCVGVFSLDSTNGRFPANSARANSRTFRETRNAYPFFPTKATDAFVRLPSPPSRRDRLLFGIFSEDGDAFLGSGVSGPIRVLANNDVPKGAACLRIRCSLGGTRARFPASTSPLLQRDARGIQPSRTARDVPGDTRGAPGTRARVPAHPFSISRFAPARPRVPPAAPAAPPL